jgi:hypothetical protein
MWQTYDTEKEKKQGKQNPPLTLHHKKAKALRRLKKKSDT